MMNLYETLEKVPEALKKIKELEREDLEKLQYYFDISIKDFKEDFKEDFKGIYFKNLRSILDEIESTIQQLEDL